MEKIYLNADELAGAFPAAVRQDVRSACETFPSARDVGQKLSLRVRDELVTIPGRLHFDPALIRIDPLTALQREIIDCLLTRHTDGFVRQQHLARVVRVGRAWIPPFVVQLAGEYVVEILDVIYQSLPTLDTSIYREFFSANPTFMDLIGQRIASYWNCYYRKEKREEYVGFKILEFFRSLEQPK